MRMRILIEVVVITDMSNPRLCVHDTGKIKTVVGRECSLADTAGTVE